MEESIGEIVLLILLFKHIRESDFVLDIVSI